MFVTVGGRLSDIFGRRWFFIAGAIILIIGSIVSATGQSINQMIAGGALFGCGSGFLEMAFGAVQEIVPSKYRHVTIGLFDAASIIAQIMPLVSWVIIKQTGNWRICYYVMIGFQAINLALLILFYHPPSWKDKKAEHGKTAGQLLREFDWLGLFLFLAGCTLFIVGVSWGGSQAPWVSATVLGPIIIGLVTLIGLGFYEAYYNLTAPLFPPRLFRALRHFTVPMLVMAIGGYVAPLDNKAYANELQNAILLERNSVATPIPTHLRHRRDIQRLVRRSPTSRNHHRWHHCGFQQGHRTPTLGHNVRRRVTDSLRRRHVHIYNGQSRQVNHPYSHHLDMYLCQPLERHGLGRLRNRISGRYRHGSRSCGNLSSTCWRCRYRHLWKRYEQQVRRRLTCARSC